MKLADMDTCSLTDLRRSLSRCIARAKDGRRPLLVTRRGTPVAVLMSIEQYGDASQEHDELGLFVRACAMATLSRADGDGSDAGVADDVDEGRPLDPSVRPR
jgi:prevent-host-death family protein